MTLFGLTNLTDYLDQFCLLQLHRTFVRDGKTSISVTGFELEIPVYLLSTVIGISDLFALTVINRTGIDLMLLTCTYFCVKCSPRTQSKRLPVIRIIKVFFSRKHSASCSCCCYLIPDVLLFFRGFYFALSWYNWTKT